MARLNVRMVGDGQHPSEAIVAVNTADGNVEVILDRQSIKNGSVDVGYPVGQNGNLLLVELPRETVGGAWRVWVDPAELSGITARA